MPLYAITYDQRRRYRRHVMADTSTHARQLFEDSGSIGDAGQSPDELLETVFVPSSLCVERLPDPEDVRPFRTFEVGLYVTDLQVASIEARDEAEALLIARQRLDAHGAYEGDFETVSSERSTLVVR